MKKSPFINEQIAFVLKQAEAGTPVTEICKKMGVGETTFYRWKKKLDVRGVSEV
jgi:putative transposase